MKFYYIIIFLLCNSLQAIRELNNQVHQVNNNQAIIPILLANPIVQPPAQIPLIDNVIAVYRGVNPAHGRTIINDLPVALANSLPDELKKMKWWKIIKEQDFYDTGNGAEAPWKLKLFDKIQTLKFVNNALWMIPGNADLERLYQHWLQQHCVLLITPKTHKNFWVPKCFIRQQSYYKLSKLVHHALGYTLLTTTSGIIAGALYYIVSNRCCACSCFEPNFRSYN